MEKSRVEFSVAYVVILIFWEQSEEFLQEHHELICHLLELMDVAISVHIAVACSYGVVHEEDARELVP